MAKAKKAETTEESKHDDTHDIGSTLEAGPSDEPPIDESNYERVNEYADDIDVDSSNSDADVDYLPDEGGDDGRDCAGGDEGDGDSLLSPEQLKSLGNKAEQMRRPVSHMKCDDHGNSYTIGEVDVKGAKAVAALDWLVLRRSLWVGGKGVEKSRLPRGRTQGKGTAAPEHLHQSRELEEVSHQGQGIGPLE